MLPSAWQQQLQHTAHALQQGQQQRAGLRQATPCPQRLHGADVSGRAGQHIGSSIHRKQHGPIRQRTSVSTAAASISSCTGSDSTPRALLSSRRSSQCCCSLPQAKLPQQQRMAQHGSKQRQRSAQLARAASRPPPDPWQQPPGTGGVGTAADWSGNSGYGPPNGNGSNGRQSPNGSYDAWDAAAVPPAGNGNGSRNGMPRYDQTDWGWTSTPEDWDPAEGLGPQQLADMERDYEQQLQRRRNSQDVARDKWITPLLDWESIRGAFDPDQSRTEESMADEALTNKEESREALAFIGRLVVIPLVTGALISRAITDPVLSFSLQNNPNAFRLSEHQKLEGAQALHMEETRLKMMMAIGQIPPLNESGMLEHLHEFALEFQEEEREKNEASLMTLVSDSISAMVFFIMFVRDNDAREALFSTIGRLFEGLSDIAKAVMIILVADTLLGYHSEEGWTGFLDLFLGHYGIEVEEESIVLFVGIIPIAIDVLFKYWIFIGLNRISPGAVVTIKQLDRH